MDGLHPDEPEFPSDTRCHYNIHVTLQEAVQQPYMHGTGPGKLEEDAAKVGSKRALLAGADMETEAKRPTSIAGMG